MIDTFKVSFLSASRTLNNHLIGVPTGSSSRILDRVPRDMTGDSSFKSVTFTLNAALEPVGVLQRKAYAVCYNVYSRSLSMGTEIVHPSLFHPTPASVFVLD